MHLFVRYAAWSFHAFLLGWCCLLLYRRSQIALLAGAALFFALSGGINIFEFFRGEWLLPPAAYIVPDAAFVLGLFKLQTRESGLRRLILITAAAWACSALDWYLFEAGIWELSLNISIPLSLGASTLLSVTAWMLPRADFLTGEGPLEM